MCCDLVEFFAMNCYEVCQSIVLCRVSISSKQRQAALL
jgi:hypothetical protein